MQQIIPIPVDVPAQQSTRTGAPSATGIEGLFAEHLTTTVDQKAVQNLETRDVDSTTSTGPTDQIAGQALPLVDNQKYSLENSREVTRNTELFFPQVNGSGFPIPDGSGFPIPDSETPQVVTAQDVPVLLAGSTQALDNNQTISRILNSITDPRQIENSKELQKVTIATAALTGDTAGQTFPGEADKNKPSVPQVNVEQLFQNQSIKNTLANGETISVSPEKSSTGQQTPVGSSLLFTAVQMEAGTTTQQSAIRPDTSHLHTQAGRTANSQGSSTVTIENWSATFAPEDTQQARSPGLQYGHQRVENKENGAQVGVFQSDKGQVITVSQLDVGSQQHSRAFSAGTQPITDSSGQRQDINSNFIHSNLPNGSVKSNQPNGQAQQQAANGEAQQQPDKSISADQLLTKEPLNDKEPPLIFSLDQVNAPTTKTVPQMPLTASLYRMPSGLQVPDGTPMDQVINQLATGKKLETGSVTLRLHPQELGELRMEIRVEQDNIKAHITTQNPQAQEMLDRHLPRLREALEQQGLRLDQVEITVADKNDNRQMFQNHHDQQQLDRSKTNHRQVPITALNSEEEPEEGLEPQQSLNVLA